MLTSRTNQCLRHYISYSDFTLFFIRGLKYFMNHNFENLNGVRNENEAFCENCCNWKSVRVILEARFSRQQPVGSSLTIQYWFMISTYVTQAGKSSIAFLKNFKVYKNILRQAFWMKFELIKLVKRYDIRTFDVIYQHFIDKAKVWPRQRPSLWLDIILCHEHLFTAGVWDRQPSRINSKLICLFLH